MTNRPTPSGNLKKALDGERRQGRLWDCPVAGGPFCPLDCADPAQADLNLAWRTCPECGGWPLSY